MRHLLLVRDEENTKVNTIIVCNSVNDLIDATLWTAFPPDKYPPSDDPADEAQMQDRANSLIETMIMTAASEPYGLAWLRSDYIEFYEPAQDPDEVTKTMLEEQRDELTKEPTDAECGAFEDALSPAYISSDTENKIRAAIYMLISARRYAIDNNVPEGSASHIDKPGN